MSSRVDVPDVRFIVCGAQGQRLKTQVRDLGISDRFEFRGFVRDIRPILEILDVFGYPLCPETYATSDQALQEAMFAGIPPVIFPYGGIRDMVRHDDTGLIVESPAAYTDAIRHLALDPQERARLGRNARAYAIGHFGAARTASQFDQIYREMMAKPKRERAGLAEHTHAARAGAFSGAELLLLSLAGGLPEFEISAAENAPYEVRIADRRIAESTPAVADVVRQYLARFNSDPLLAMWDGLIDGQAGQHARALIKFRHALECGGDELRLRDYIADAARTLGATAEAIAVATHITEA
jgi:hypothetical protein